MFTQPLQMGRQKDEESFYTHQAHNLFWERYEGSPLKTLRAVFRSRSRHLQSLSEALQHVSVAGRHYAGVQLVALEAIRGSENRGAEFDSEFRPRHRHMYRRWVSVAAAWLAGVVFAPVELIKVGDDYFVRDGHHRISVARAMGQRYIDAEVTIWEVHGQPEELIAASCPTGSCQPAFAF